MLKHWESISEFAKCFFSQSRTLTEWNRTGVIEKNFNKKTEVVQPEMLRSEGGEP